MSRRQLSFNGHGKKIGFALVASVVLPALQIIVAPLLFRSLGSAEFGVWTAINAVLAVSAIAGFGLAEAVTRYSAELSVRGQQRELIRMVRTLTTLSWFISIGAALTVAFSAHRLALSLGFEGDGATSAAEALRLAGLGVPIRFFQSSQEALLRGLMRQDVENVLLLVSGVAIAVATAVAATAGFGLSSLVLILVAVNTVVAMTMTICNGYFLKGGAFLLPLVDRASFRMAAKYGLITWGQSLNGMVAQHLDKFIVGGVLGASAVGVYGLCMQVVQSLTAIVARCSALILPLTVRYQAERRKDALGSLFDVSVSLSMLGGWFIFGSLMILAGPILDWWMGPIFRGQAEQLLIILAVWGGVTVGSPGTSYMLNGCGRERMNLLIGSASSVALLLGLLGMLPVLGIAGAALARIATIPLVLISRTILVESIFGARDVRKVMGSVLPIAFPLGGLWVLIVSDLGSGLVQRGGVFVVTSVVFLLLWRSAPGTSRLKDAICRGGLRV
jgi:O-antigen/teichoic acid export membrane protein